MKRAAAGRSAAAAAAAQRAVGMCFCRETVSRAGRCPSEKKWGLPVMCAKWAACRWRVVKRCLRFSRNRCVDGAVDIRRARWSAGGSSNAFPRFGLAGVSPAPKKCRWAAKDMAACRLACGGPRVCDSAGTGVLTGQWIFAGHAGRQGGLPTLSRGSVWRASVRLRRSAAGRRRIWRRAGWRAWPALVVYAALVCRPSAKGTSLGGLSRA